MKTEKENDSNNHELNNLLFWLLHITCFAVNEYIILFPGVFLFSGERVKSIYLFAQTHTHLLSEILYIFNIPVAIRQSTTFPTDWCNSNFVCSTFQFYLLEFQKKPSPVKNHITFYFSVNNLCSHTTMYIIHSPHKRR